MNNRLAQLAQANNVRPGQFLTLDPIGRLVRVSDSVTSFSAEIYRLNRDGSFTRIH